MFDRTWDATVRNAAFEWLRSAVHGHGDVLPRALLAEGLTLDGARVPLLGPQGIFKPRVLRDAPLSITTAPNGPYDDAFGPNDLLRYRYRGTDPDHTDNRSLRFAMQERLPLIYLHGLVPGRYVATWPVFVVADDRGGLTFTIAVDDARHVWPATRVHAASDSLDNARRQRFGSGYTRARFGNASWPHTDTSVRSAGSGTPSYWTRLTSYPTPTRGNRWYRTAWRSASSITPHSIGSSSGSAPTTWCRYVQTCWMKRMDPR